MKLREYLSCAMAAVLILPPGMAARKTTPDQEQAKRDARQFQAKLSKDDQIMHALDRLTFGPRPGDVAQVRRMGVKKWVDQQLHPERIAENPFLTAKLQPLESLRMSPMEATQHYPQPQMIKAIADGRQPMPEDPLLRVAVQRMILRYKGKKGTAADSTDDMDPVKPLSQVLDAAQIKTLQTGTPDQKRALLQSLPADQLEDFVVALPRQMRNQLLNAAPTDLRRKLMLLNSPQQVIAYDLLESKLMRAIYSNRQLAEELDDFWFNHFNIYYDKGADRFLIPSFEREAIQPHVLGHFRDLLEATAKSPAMLFYLDNFQSVRADLDAKAKGKNRKRGINENYARELMELHTLGVNGGYTQKDVMEVARCFTGWGIQDPRKGGGFFYNDKVHDKGEKLILGHVISAGGGQNDAEKVLDILAHHPSTARFISRKLAQRFVADNPPQALLDRMAKTFMDKDGDIREVMRTMLTSKEFWSKGAYQAKVKTPFEMVASAARALDAKVDDAFALANQVGQLGEPLYRKQEPTGYSNLNTEWVNSAALLARMNFALALAQNKVPGVKIDPKKFGTADPSEIAKTLMFRDVSPQTRASLEKATTPAVVAGLVLGSPDFQRR
ncbi:MAG: DUF1800 domain-containing protein [Acidobacteriota bacterium]|nr:DUF1800 domain-containing protein [Acidobacteriota bacterium]